MAEPMPPRTAESATRPAQGGQCRSITARRPERINGNGHKDGTEKGKPEVGVDRLEAQQADRQCDEKCGTGIDAEDAGICEQVSRRRLYQRAGNTKGRTAENTEHGARQTIIAQYDVLRRACVIRQKGINRCGRREQTCAEKKAGER